MVDGQLGAVLRYIRGLGGAGGGAPTTDAELLKRFATRRDEAAFAALVERHGPMVLGVCRRILGRSQDVDDAFQATFLVLVRRAGSLSRPELVGNWLYGVAQRIALRARAQGRKRHDRERPMIDTAGEPDESAVVAGELRHVLDEELRRLPEKYRAPLVLHYLSGRTHAETARDLGWPVGTVAGRLAQGRRILRARLTRRGVSLATVLVACGLAAGRAPAAVPASLRDATLSATLRLAAGAAVGATPAAGLAGELVRGLLLSRVRTVVGLALVVGGIMAGAAALLASRVPADPLPAGPEAAPDVAPWQGGFAVQHLDGQVWRDRLGDPLPRGAVARLGTTRGRHTDNLSALALSPDGKLLATRAGDDRVRLWDASTGKELHALGGPHGSPGLWGFAFAPDGGTLVTCGADGLVRFWDLATGRERFQVLGNPRGVRAVAFSGDGKLLAVGGEDNRLDLWDPAAGKELRRLGQAGGPLTARQAELFPLRDVAFSPDDRALAALYLPPDAGQKGFLRCLEMRDVETGRMLRKIGVPMRLAGQPPFSPDGREVFWLSQTGTVSLRAVATGEEVRRFDDGAGANAVAVSRDGGTLAVASPQSIRLWDVVMGTRLQVLADSANRACLAFSRDGRTLAAGGYDGTFQLWNTATGEKLLRPFPGHEGPVLCVASSPDGKTLATCCSGSPAIRLWQASTGKELRRWKPPSDGGATSLTFAPDGKTLAGTGADGLVRLWDPATGSEVGRFPRQGAPAGSTRLRFSPDGKLLATCSSDGSLRLYTPAGQEVACLQEAVPGPANPIGVAAVAFCPDGRLVAGAEGSVVRLWNVATGKEVRRLAGVEWPVTALAFSPDGQSLASAGEKDEVSLWDVATGRERGRLVCRGSSADRLHPDGYRNRETRPGPFNSLQFTPDGHALLGGRADGGVYVWDPAGSRPAGKVYGHKEAVTCLAVCGDGKTLASASADRTVLVWDITALMHALGERDR
jgi:RNA polymerase sigma factor (sigma-70 family)